MTTNLAKKPIAEFETSAGAKIFQIPLNGFSGFWVYAYVVSVDGMLVLIDTGTNFHTSNQDLESGLDYVGERLGQTVDFQTLTHIFITHGHIDHYAGLDYIAPKTPALIGVHELDYKILTNYHERKDLVGMKLERYLIEAGVTEAKIPGLVNMYMMTTELFTHSRVDFTYHAVGMQVGPFEFFHVPGHSAGAVVIRLHDTLFTGDHILSDITPHQAPESLTLNTGLSHYLDSLRSMLDWAGSSKQALGGHNQVINDLPKRVAEIYLEHKNRLALILDIIADHPQTTVEVSRALFGRVNGFNVLLALEETGAHIEYLYRLGFISLENLEEVKSSSKSHVYRYQSLRGKADLELVYPKL